METLRMSLTKRYQAGTGDSNENRGHEVTIQVEWNLETKQFEDIYYLQTSQHHDENSVVIKHEPTNSLHTPKF